MNKLFMKRICLTVISALFYSLLKAQSVADSASPSIDTTMRSHNKIYVVMTVCIVILTVLFLYLIRIDIKVSKKEKSAL
ncbi:MAG: CcmD family protein [Ginsengibacter sp.]|jgi:heme/copper-type cytochrome/quinol oxidase subunit 2